MGTNLMNTFNLANIKFNSNSFWWVDLQWQFEPSIFILLIEDFFYLDPIFSCTALLHHMQIIKVGNLDNILYVDTRYNND
jgi:hypothetical protein